MAISKIQKGDNVKVITGAFRGHVGQVTKVVKKLKGKNLTKRVAVSGLKKLTKFRKKMVYQGQAYPGQMTEVERLIDVSNVALLTGDKKVSKVGIKLDKDGKKNRFYKKTGDLVPRSVKNIEGKDAKTEEPVDKKSSKVKSK